MGRLASLTSFASLFVLSSMLLAAVGQPLFTDDTWWHLAHGQAYAIEGPRLSHDPLLYTAPGPPAPASWLADVGLHFLHRAGGFSALRIAHVVIVASILAMLWVLLARTSRSRLFASVGVAVFICLSTYRLVQLRPHLFTILATLLLYHWLFSESRAPTLRRVACSVVLLGVWANVHAAFVLGPTIIATGIAGIWLGEAFKQKNVRQFTSTRVRRLAIALALGALATCVNPAGIGPHFAYLIAGNETPSLARVGDEWASIDLLSLPHAGAIPSPLDWFLIWILLLGCGTVVARAVPKSRRARGGAFDQIDFATLAISVLSFAAMLIAVRFVWLSIFPLLFLAASLDNARIKTLLIPTSTRSIFATAMLGLLISYSMVGSWHSVSRALPHTSTGYARSYPSEKYHAHTVWFLRDAKLEGNLFAEYYLGGFLGYWLAPELRTFINGSLNVTRDAVDSNLPIRERRGARSSETFLELLDRQNVDIFMGIQLPRENMTARPWFHTTAHLEGAPGWIQVFRNITSAVYLRATDANRNNLEQVANYYRTQGVPFDTSVGFKPEDVIEASPDWAIAHGVVPKYFQRIIETINDTSSPKRLRSLNMLAEVYAALGVYDRSIATDRELIRAEPKAISAQRRLTWSLLRSKDFRRARAEANTLRDLAPGDALARSIVAVAMQTDALEEDRARAIAQLAVFRIAEANRLMAGIERPKVRER